MIAAIRTAYPNNTAGPPATARSAASPFADIFATATAGASTPQVEGRRATDVPAVPVDTEADLATALAAFRKEASLTPTQRARRDVIEAMGLSEDASKAMPPEQRETVEAKIAAEVARRLRVAGSGARTGIAGTLSV
ncbi:MAG: hypothetical protein V4537_03995 [Pseudomonadota bacterium]